MTDTHSELVSEMRRAVPAGLPRLDRESRETLRGLTAQLLATPSADIEYRRYRGIEGRMLTTTGEGRLVGDRYRGKRILVTGGTGCIGAELLRQLVGYDPADLHGVYALSGGFDPVPGVRYTHVDIRDEAAIRATVRSIRPDVIFHCAAQRSPWLAERQVERTLATNVLGTRNVLRAARDVDLPLFVHASTGKAMRYHTTDVYAASKKLAEWLVHEYATEGRTAGLARFTHVVNNAVVLEKVDDSLRSEDGVMRVHNPEAYFYAQSASESAQLLIVAGLEADTDLRAVAIRELGEPVGLVDVVVGRMHERAAAKDAPVIYFSGYDAGYEHGNPPGLYDPSNAGEISPLINAVEARTARAVTGLSDVDSFRLSLPHGQRQAEILAERIAATCRSGDRVQMLAELTSSADRQADVALREASDDLFMRLKTMAERAGEPLPTTRGRRMAA